MTFLLVHRGALRLPLLYLSHYLRLHRSEYYDRLMAVPEGGDWEGWVKFFLDGVRATAEEATRTAGAIVALREQHRVATVPIGRHGLRLLDYLYQRPLVQVGTVREALGVSFPTASKLVTDFAERGLLEELTGFRRNRVFRYTPYLVLFRESDADVATGGPHPVAATESDARIPHWIEDVDSA